MKRRIFINILLAFILVLGGCSRPNPEDTISRYFKGIKNGNFYSTQQYFASEENEFNKITSTNEEIYKQAFRKINYKIIDSDINGQTATVKTKIIAPDIPKIMGRVVSAGLEITFFNDIKKVANDKIIQIINSEDMPVTTKEININLKLVNKKWLIEPDSSFIRAITGNNINIID